MVSAVDQQRVCALLTEAMTVICKNGLTFNNKFCIEGLLGITMDDSKMFLVNIRETVHKARPDGGKEHKSDSMSKAGMLVGGRPMMQAQQGMRTGSPMGLGRPGMGLNAANQQMMAQRRRGGPLPQNLIPAKRQMIGPGQAPPGGMKIGPGGAPEGGGGSMPQEWAALIQLQQQQKPLGQITTFPHRGRGRPTARRGGGYRGGLSRGGMTQPMGDGMIKAVRRNSQSGVELETREELEKKAAEQAKSRSERLQRRHAVLAGEPYKPEMTSPGKDQEGKNEDSTADDMNTLTDDTAPREEQDQHQHTDTEPDTDKTSQHEKQHEKDDASTARETDKADNRESTETHDNGETKNTAKAETENENTTAEDGKEESKEGDGSWLLSNSNWLLGDLEAPAHIDDEKVEKTGESG